MDKLRTYIMIAIGIFTLSGAVYGVITYYTPLSQHEALAGRVTKGELQNQIRWVQQQIWLIQKNYNCFSYDECMRTLPDSVKDQYRYLEQELERLHKELK